MEIKRVEPNNTPVIRFCCDEMFEEFCTQRNYLIDDGKLLHVTSSRSIKFCHNCGERVEHGTS